METLVVKKLLLKTGSGKELDLFDTWQSVQIIRRDDSFATSILITFTLDEFKLIQRDFATAKSLLLIIENSFQNRVVERLNWETKITSVSASQIGRTGHTSNLPVQATITVNVAPIDIERSKDIVGGSYKNINGNTLIQTVCSGLNLESKPSTITSPLSSVFIPSMPRTKALSYICCDVGIYDSPTYFLHDFDINKGRCYLTNLKEEAKDRKYKLLFTSTNTSEEKKKYNDYTLVAGVVIITPNIHELQFTPPHNMDVKSYTHTEFYQTTNITLPSLMSIPVLGQLQSTTDRKQGLQVLDTFSGNATATQLGYSFLSAITLTASVSFCSRFGDLRPGTVIDFVTSGEEYVSLVGSYVLKSVLVRLHKLQGKSIADVELVLQRYSLEFKG